MPDIVGLVGPSNWLRSGLTDFERSINVRPERAVPGNPKTQSWLGNTPGLRYVTTIGPMPVECLFWVIGRVFGVSGTITLSQPLPDLNADVSINGPGASALTVERNYASGTPAFRIFTVDSGVTASISGLTLSFGNANKELKQNSHFRRGFRRVQ